MHISRRKFLQASGIAAATGLVRLPRAFSSGKDSDLCRKLASDPLRPQYHLLPARNWMNDPNGPIFYRGKYHMFHQYNPQGAVWGNMNWAHATSPDMIHWRHNGIALSPTEGGPDQDGVFSGSAVLDHGKPTMIYTAVAPPKSGASATLRDGAHIWRETQCLAVAMDEELRTWKKLAGPVIAEPPAGLVVTGFRDPCLWRENGRWMLALGSGTRERGGMILLYTSQDLRHWEYLHPLVESSPSGMKSADPVHSGDMWECPDFFPLGKKHVLLISTKGNVRWKVGTYEKERFTPEKEGVVDWGSYYAAKTMIDRDGTRILWGWISETRSDAELTEAGWAGAMSLPRVMSLNAQDEFVTEVASVAKRLRTEDSPMNLASKKLADIRIHDLCAELDLHLHPRSDEFVLTLQSEGGAPFATISCAAQNGGREIRVNNLKAPLAGGAGAPVHLHMYLDGSVLELFANQATSMTARVYQAPDGPLRLAVKGSVEVERVSAWQMTPISKDRLTGSACG